MSANPFAPPRAVVDDLPDPAASNLAARKPVSAWLMQGASLLLVTAFSTFVLRDVTGRLSGLSPAAMVFFLALTLGSTCTLPLLAVWTTQRRMRLGRWTGAAFLVLLLAFGLWVLWLGYAGFEGHRHAAYDWRIWMTLAVLWFVGLVGWIWFFTFSRAAVAWFTSPRRRR